jgi:hypothetical protein
MEVNSEAQEENADHTERQASHTEIQLDANEINVDRREEPAGEEEFNEDDHLFKTVEAQNLIKGTSQPDRTGPFLRC